ncbi:serine/threonine-protein kinase [Pseudohalioglobus lutimaris]|uniref:Protein kinase domain-containing protein n=1 Tax=Pseudohalioglobus lutimaris TaxID=1737061 RepID=A0A2N5X793_9GAMM|nr:serine/threonine-protein kinase [Pseudohalioglobus lutimaris]PLW70349.1 hypothetical protein C0039_03855 [Pseudohalioglobus lutimaris]
MAENSIGPYSIVRLIKQGGQGSVYLGYDGRLRRKVAIKIDALPESRAARRRALAEARKAARINSPHVVQIYDLVESGGYLAIVMEYVPGVDLEEVLTHRRLSLSSILAVAAEVSAALAASRQRRIVHGDLKAANVLIARSGDIKLTDFGIARHCADAGPATAGSPGAITPEHVDGSSLDVRSDLFALGALLFRMLTGEHAFFRHGKTDTAALLEVDRSQLWAQMPGQEAVPGDLLPLVESLLQTDPADRPQNTHPVRSQLRALQRSLPLHAANSLQDEASPYYRPESPEDIPLEIPRPLCEKGRSRLEYSAGSRLLRYLSGLRMFTRITLAAVFLFTSVALVAVATHERPVRVHFEAPQIVFASRDGVPGDINREWLMRNVQAAVGGELGAMQVSGSVHPRAYYASLADKEPEYVINTGLRCSAVLCVFSISRENAGQFDFRQAVISPGLPETAWTTLVEHNSRALFP